jgi:hypothetical protein
LILFSSGSGSGVGAGGTTGSDNFLKANVKDAIIFFLINNVSIYIYDVC